MRHFFIHSAILFIAFPLHSQVHPGQFSLRLGYNACNPHAKRVNYLVNEFNAARFPGDIVTPLPTLSFTQGIVAGAGYRLGDYFVFTGVFRNNHQLLRCQYSGSGYYRQYLFRTDVIEIGANYLFQDEGKFRHFGSFGILAGNLSVFTDWTPGRGRGKSGEMFNIDHSALVGISAGYEAQILLVENVYLFIRPNLRLAAGSQVRNLTDFMNPAVTEGNQVSFHSDEIDKYNVIGMNGFGIEAGIILNLPENLTIR